MKVKALRSFASPLGTFAEGDVFDLPKGTDWLKCGLVEKVPPKRKAKTKKALANEADADNA